MQIVSKTDQAGLLTYDIIRSTSETNKALLIVPGLNGHGYDYNIMEMADEAHKNGYNVLIMNPQGSLKENGTEV